MSISSPLGVVWYLWAASGAAPADEGSRYAQAENTYAGMRKCRLIVVESFSSLESPSPLHVARCVFAITFGKTVTTSSTFRARRMIGIQPADVLNFSPAHKRGAKVQLFLGENVSSQVRRVFELCDRGPDNKWFLAAIDPDVTPGGVAKAKAKPKAKAKARCAIGAGSSGTGGVIALRSDIEVKDFVWNRRHVIARSSSGLFIRRGDP